MKPWIGVDLDGTLAYYDKWVAWNVIGEPIPLMLARIKTWLAEGKTVIQNWLEKQNLPRLKVTATKDVYMIELWDDRCIQVIPNTGKTLAEEHLSEITALKGKP